MTRIVRPVACRVVLIAGIVTCLAATATAQGFEGGVRGSVTDGDGDPIEDATITAESLTSSARQTATTNDSGRFSFIRLNRGEWRFVVQAEGFVSRGGVATVRAAGPPLGLTFSLEIDPFNPLPPAGGVLAELRARELVEGLEEAEGFFDNGEYDAAIAAYRSMLVRAPALTSLSLQIGHAYREKQELDEALAAYRTVLDADPSNVEARAAIEAVNQSR